MREGDNFMNRIPKFTVQLVRDGSALYDSSEVHEPNDAWNIAKKYLVGADREYFFIMMLNSQKRVTGINTVSCGSLTMSIVHPREVFKAAILGNAEYIILVHNHPSGNQEPSMDDRKITERLRRAGKIIGINVLDHIILGDSFYSFCQSEGWAKRKG